jgi:hypothetical protein
MSAEVPNYARALCLQDGFLPERDETGGLQFQLNLGAVRIAPLQNATTGGATVAWIQAHVHDTMQRILADGKPATVLIQMKGFSWTEHTNKVLLQPIDEALQSYDCACVRKVRLLNVPKRFKLAWKLLRPLVSDELRALVETKENDSV